MTPQRDLGGGYGVRYEESDPYLDVHTKLGHVAAAINEAVEIAKHYESQEVVSFVNGILGSFVRAEFADTPPKPEKAARAEEKTEE